MKLELPSRMRARALVAFASACAYVSACLRMVELLEQRRRIAHVRACVMNACVHCVRLHVERGAAESCRERLHVRFCTCSVLEYAFPEVFGSPGFAVLTVIELN